MLVRRIRRRGANIVVEAHGEVLFAPTGDVGRWTNRFSHRVRAASMAVAPVNKRPRWGHYGKPLKSTFTASTTYQPGRMRVYAAIGSSSPHAYYVDQGTGVYAGNGPYEAKVLPPWSRGDASLYEATWRPGGVGTRKVAPVVIRGQKGQFFFNEGIKRGFQSMRMRSFQVPGDGQITKALSSLPSGLLGFLGNTPNDGAFRASLEEWRAWRDEAFSRGESLNRSPFNAQAKMREKAAAAKKKQTAIKKAAAKPTKKPAVKKPAVKKPAVKKPAKPKKKKQGYETVREKQDDAVKAFLKQNPGIKIKGRIPSGLVVVAPATGEKVIIPWSRIYNLL